MNPVSSSNPPEDALRPSSTSLGQRDCVITTDAMTRVTFLNPAAEALTGWSLAAALGNAITNLFHLVDPASRTPIENIAVTSLREGSPVPLPPRTLLLDRTGRKHLVEGTASPLRSTDGLQGSVLILRDASDHTSINADVLDTADAKIRMLFEQGLVTDAMPALIAYVDTGGHYRYNNKAYEEWFGVSRETLRGKHLREVLGESAYEALRPHMEAALSGRRVQFDLEVPYKTGRRAITAAYTPDMQPDGSVTGFFALVNDVTERKRAELSLAQLAAIIESSDDAIVTKNLDGVITSWNRSAERIFGHAAAEAVGRHISIIIPPDRLDEEAEVLARLRRGETIDHFETRRVTKDGRLRNISISVSPLKNSAGQIVGASKVARDITERVRVATELRASRSDAERQRRLYEAILDNTPDFAYIFSLDHRFTYANVRLREMFGAKWDESSNKTFLEVGYPQWHAELHSREIDEVVATKKPLRGEVPFDGAFGRRIYDYIFVPVLNAQGEVEAVAGTTRDITDRKESEAERESLLNSERAARSDAERASRLKDEFLATLSHELRTPLNAILGWAHILMKGAEGNEELSQGLSIIHRNARMQAQLIADLLDMSRIISGKMRLQVQRVELPVVIEAALDAIRPAAEARNIRIESILEPITEPVRGDPSRLQQIVWNLVSNAVKFTPAGGKVQVVLARVNSHVELSVSDTGRGIPSEFLPFIFERFRQADSSASREHGGLGLGLAIVKQLVELHGGTVRAASDGHGKGCTFTIHLPLSAVHEADWGSRIHPRAASLSTPSGDLPNLAGVKVLVVDDEPDARGLVKRVLEECGATVTAAESAEAAMRCLAGDIPHVILSDIGMPDSDGYALMQRIRGAGIKVPAAAITAFARSEDRTRALNAGYQTHLAKPVEPTELIATVASLANEILRSPSA